MEVDSTLGRSCLCAKGRNHKEHGGPEKELPGPESLWVALVPGRIVNRKDQHLQGEKKGLTGKGGAGPEPGGWHPGIPQVGTSSAPLSTGAGCSGAARGLLVL